MVFSQCKKIKWFWFTWLYLTTQKKLSSVLVVFGFLFLFLVFFMIARLFFSSCVIQTLSISPFIKEPWTPTSATPKPLLYQRCSLTAQGVAFSCCLLYFSNKKELKSNSWGLDSQLNNQECVCQHQNNSKENLKNQNQIQLFTCEPSENLHRAVHPWGYILIKEIQWVLTALLLRVGPVINNDSHNSWNSFWLSLAVKNAGRKRQKA